MNNINPAIFAVIGIVALIVGAIGLVIAIFYILTLRKALLRCAPHNRTTTENSPWLLLIPLFNLVWTFILYPKISESLEREFRQRNLPIEPQPAKSLGLTLAILQACCIIPILNYIAGLAALVCFILYWVKISGYSSRLAAAPAYAAMPPQWSTQPPLAPPPAMVNQCSCGAPLSGAGGFCNACGRPVAMS